MRMSPRNAKTYKKRALTGDDRVDWYDAGTTREVRGPEPRTREDIIALLRNRNPVRWRHIKKEYAWMQKELRKMGLNPDDARFLL